MVKSQRPTNGLLSGRATAGASKTEAAIKPIAYIRMIASLLQSAVRRVLPSLGVPGHVRVVVIPMGRVGAIGEQDDGLRDHAVDLGHIAVIDLLPDVAGGVIVGEVERYYERVRGDAVFGEGEVIAASEIVVIMRCLVDLNAGQFAGF